MDTSSVFKPYRDYHHVRGDKQKMISNSIGRQLPYLVNFQKNICQIFDIELELITHAFEFPDGSELIDVDYFPTEDEKFGIIVGVEDGKKTWGAEHFILALTPDAKTPTMSITNALEVPEKVTVVKTLYTSSDLAEGRQLENLRLFPKLLQWPHIVAVGCKRSRCFLTSLPEVDKETEVQIRKSKNSVDLMACYVEDDVFKYSNDDVFIDYPVNGVYVSSLALMPRSRTLLIGLSMGGIISAALNPSNQMTMLELRHERLIHALAPLEPEDDPDKFEYFIAAVDRSSRHPIMLTMYRGAFQKEGDPSGAKYDTPMYGACVEHKIMFGERWISVKPIIQERSMELAQRRRNDSSMDSLVLNTSQLFGCSVNRSNVFLAYERKTVEPTASGSLVVEAAIFDIDAWYYTRVPSRITADTTIFRQCPFMSCIKSDIPSSRVNEIGILTLDSTNMYRFSSLISDADQLFYPSSTSYERVFVIHNNQVQWMKIQSIQETILQKCAAKLPSIVRSPEIMAGNIIAAGLVRKNILTGSPNSSAAEVMEEEHQLSLNLRVVLNAMIYYGKIDAFCSLTAREELSNRIKVDIADWSFLEAVEYKRIVSDRVVSIFQGSTSALSPLAEDTLHQGIKLFRVVHEYLRGCSVRVKEGNTHLPNYARSTKCMFSHTKLVRQFVNVNIVPLNHQVEIEMQRMHEKRKLTASKNKTALPVQIAIRNMHRLAPNAQFWNDMPHDQWYPPTPLDLLEPILNISISERLKRDIIVQYALDYVRAAQPESNDFTDEKLALEVIKIMTNQMLDVDLEKIRYVLEQEREAMERSAVVIEDDKTVKKVFSIETDELTYEELWSGNVCLGPTIKQTDLEKFRQRMKNQEENGENKKKWPVFDSATEKLYQVFLCENQKYHLMSSEAIESNHLLKMFYPKAFQDDRSQKKPLPPKSAKELEIEKSVKEMFQKQYERDQLKKQTVFATMGSENAEESNGEVRRKRRSEILDGEQSTSPTIFVPPTAKRILTRRGAPEEAPAEAMDAEPVRHEDDHLNQLIATPARYYKRPAPRVDMTSPTHLQQPPPVPKQNSILKTAKALQSPGRGRIRFHASVRKGPNESIDSAPGDDQGEEEEIVDPKKINFAILEDEEDDQPTYIRRSRSNSKTQENAETPKPQDGSFEVLEDIEETTFELQDEDENVKTLDENATYEECQTMETDAENAEEQKPEDSQETVDIEMQIETNEEEESGKPKEATATESTDMYEEPEWDGIERSFEHQADADCEPVSNQEEPVFKAPSPPTLAVPHVQQEEDEEADDVDNEIAEDVPLDRTFEVQDEEDEPKPRGDAEMGALTTSSTFTVEPPKQTKQKKNVSTPTAADASNHSAISRPPSANTRSRSRNADGSRSATPEENAKPNDTTTTSITTAQPARATRAASVQKLSNVPEEESGTKPQNEEAEGPGKRTRRASASREAKQVTPEPVETEDNVPKRSGSRTRATRAASVQKLSNIAAEETSTKDQSEEAEAPAKRTRRASASRDTQQVTPEPVETGENVPKRSASRARATRAASVQKLSNVAEEETSAKAQSEEVETPAKRTRRASASRTASQVTPEPVEAEENAPKRPASRARATRAASAQNVPDVVQEDDEAARPASRGKRAPPVKKVTTRSRVNSETVVTEPEKEIEATPTTRTRGSRAASRNQTPSRTVDDAAPAESTTRRGRKASERQVTPDDDDAPASIDVTGSALSRRLSTRVSVRSSSVQSEVDTPAKAATASAKKTTARANVTSAPSTPRRGRQKKSESEEVVVPTSGLRGASKRKNTPGPEEDTPRTEPVKKAAKGGRGKTTSLVPIPEAGETNEKEPDIKPTDTPKRGRSRTNSTSSSASAPSTPKRGRKGAAVATSLDAVVEEDAPESSSVRRSARRLQQKP